MRVADAVIVGAGPAGIAAAVQLVRHGIVPVVFERREVGGLLLNAHLVENYPGFPGGVSGRALVKLMAQQLAASGAEIVRERVVALDREDDSFCVTTEASETRARTAIVASGTRAIDLEGVDIAAPARPRIYSEVHALREVPASRIAVLGSGDAAFDYAMTLAQGCRVTIIRRGSTRRCLDVLAERVSASADIEEVAQTRLTAVEVADGGGLSLVCESRGGRSRIEADYLVVAIGREPDDGFLTDRLLAAAPDLETKGDLHFAGDVRSGIFRQASIAAGQGVLAAMRTALKLTEEIEE